MAILHRSETPFWRRKLYLGVIGALFVVLAIALGVGLGLGLTRASRQSRSSTTTNANGTTYWQPEVGATWQIKLQDALKDTSPNVSVYDIDLFDNPSTTIDNLHALNRKVICYFSAGTYENFRPDSSLFKPADYGSQLENWPGEYWLDTKSANVRSIMTARLDLAASKGCDGVDPDNVDGYAAGKATGLNLSTADAIDYLTFLADGAHQRQLSIGLKNAGAIVNATLSIMQWEINEQCVYYKECATFRPFVDAGKPVFHIEYPDDAPDISAATKALFCEDSEATGFSTVLKEMELGDWLQTC